MGQSVSGNIGGSNIDFPSNVSVQNVIYQVFVSGFVPCMEPVEAYTDFKLAYAFTCPDGLGAPKASITTGGSDEYGLYYCGYDQEPVITTVSSGHCGGSTVGNPCDPVTGRKTQSETDFVSPTLSLSRHYNSDADFNSDGIINFLDLAVVSEAFLQTPGPAGDNSLANDASIKFVHSDYLSTPVQMYDQSGQEIWSAQREPFGTRNVNDDVDGGNSPIALNVGFPGRYWDSESGLFYNYFRYYDPSLGRYITSDPIGMRGGGNTYGYVGQNPAGYIDPFGLFEVTYYDPCDEAESFQARIECSKSRKSKKLYQRARVLQALGDKFGKAIDKEENCECKKQFQSLYNNWTVTPTLQRGVGAGSNKNLYEGNFENGLGVPIGGRSELHNLAFASHNLTRFTFYHEFSHMLPEVNALTGWFGRADSPAENAADESSRHLIKAVYKGDRSLCR